MDTHQYVNWFRHSSPYINAHRGKTFLLCLSGEAVAHSNFPTIIHDIALLNSLGVKLIIVHGSRPQIDERAALHGVQQTFHNGLRVTDLESLACIKDAVGTIRADIEALLSMGLPNSPMHGAHIRVCSGNFITAKPTGVLDGVDLQHTGLVRKIDADAIKTQLANGNIVLLSHLGYSPTGEIFNLAFDDVAAHVAKRLQVDKLIVYGEAPGVVDEDNNLIRELQLSAAKSWLASGEAQDGLSLLVRAIESGVPRVHLISYQHDGALLQELFSRDGAGTLISRDSYETIRTASINDVGGILELLEPLETAGTLVKRSRELLETEIDHFTVIERDGMAVACAALYPYDDATAEIACVVTHPQYQGGGRAARLLHHLENRARALQLSRVMVLTTQTAHWFIEQGFTQGNVSELPEEKQTLYNYQRNSKVFFKPL